MHGNEASNKFSHPGVKLILSQSLQSGSNLESVTELLITMKGRLLAAPFQSVEGASETQNELGETGASE